jgi:hypothetical protein
MGLPNESKVLATMAAGGSCNRGHAMVADNVFWRLDKRRAGGGHWACRECYLENKRLASQRLREKVKRANNKRKSPVRRQKYRGPNQLVDEAAQKVALEAVTPEDVERIIEGYVLRIAAGRLRFTADRSREPTVEELAAARKQIMEAVGKLAKDESKKPWSYLQVKPEARAAWDAFNAKLEKARNTGLGLPNCEDNPKPFMDYDDDDLPTSEEAATLCYGCPLLAECGLYVELERPVWGVWAGDVWSLGEVVNE